MQQLLTRMLRRKATLRVRVVCAVGMARLEGLPPRARASSAPSPHLWNRRDSSQEVAGDKCQKRLVLIVVSRQRPHTEPLLEGHVKAVT